ncbi:hypothetical protein BDB01DRAFT_790252 [Pilobolus umbonatus]|nr:hypothetical protein BDB01DRAFT_790252 [Pilobolus umbonatus]
MTQEILADPQLASAMKEGTKGVHKAAETSEFIKRFLSGDITKNEYGRYINNLYFIYKKMESLLDQYKDDEVIKMVHFPAELNRENAILQDLEYYYGKDKIALVTSDAQITPAVQQYLDALDAAVAKNPALLIAYSYSRYLGDLSGGQIMAKRLKKHVLGLTTEDVAWEEYNGVQFYNFEHIENHMEFKKLYRSRLDSAAVTQEVKDQIVHEAVVAFDLIIATFNEIEELSKNNQFVATIGSETTSKLSGLVASAASLASSLFGK